jgi:protein TonB
MFLNQNNKFKPFSSPEDEKESAINESTRKYFSNLINDQELVKEKTPRANLKLKQRKVLEASFAIAMAGLILMFQVARQIDMNVETFDKVDVTIEVADIPQTKQFRLPPPPARPSVPIPTEEDAIPEDLTIASTDLDLSEIPAPPAPPEDDGIPIFVAYDEAPQIIGGMTALQKHLRYPRMALISGLEGIVFIRVLVGLDGKAEKTEILRAKPANMGFEESAIEASKKVTWIPAKQRDRSIRVWVSIPVQFSLVSS